MFFPPPICLFLFCFFIYFFLASINTTYRMESRTRCVQKWKEDIFIKMKLPNCKVINIYFYNRSCLLTVTVHSLSVSSVQQIRRTVIHVMLWLLCFFFCFFFCAFFWFVFFLSYYFQDSEKAVRIRRCMTLFYCSTLFGAFWHPPYFFSRQYLGKSSACVEY